MSEIIIKTASDFSGVGAFDYSINSSCDWYEVIHKRIFACDWDKFARISYIAAHGKPEYYPEDVYEREIPIDPLDIYMTSPPCQAFSIAGKRLGKEDKRGILFYNSHEFIKKNNPRFFIFENVKGLLSDDSSKTFNEWISMLGGKSVNGNMTSFFPHPEAVPYHIYWKVINAKDHGIPQNRERVFIVGIRDDEDNSFSWPKEEPLIKRLKDVLEKEVDPKYFLSKKAVNKLLNDGIDTDHLIPGDVSNTIRVGGGSLSAKHCFDMIKIVGNTNPSGNGMNGNVFDSNGISPTLSTNKGEGIKVKVVKLKRTDEAKKKRSESLKSTGKDTGSFSARKYEAVTQDYSDTILANPNPVKDGLITVSDPQIIQSGRGFNKGGLHDECPPITASSFQNNNHVIQLNKSKESGGVQPYKQNRVYSADGVFDGYSIRRLTPLECFRLMGFPDAHVQKCREAGVSCSQLYKQAGNSIVVDVLENITDKIVEIIVNTNKKNETNS